MFLLVFYYYTVDQQAFVCSCFKNKTFKAFRLRPSQAFDLDSFILMPLFYKLTYFRHIQLKHFFKTHNKH